MSQRLNFLNGCDGFTNRDDVIPRCMPRGFQPTTTVPSFLSFQDMARIWPPKFYDRVIDSIHRLRAGESFRSIAAEHGIIVAREAEPYAR